MASDRTIEPTELEVHRAAAWWAGEGSVRSKDRKLGVNVAQKERAVCDWLRERFGGTVARREPTATRNEIHYWSASGDRARAFLRAIVDLLPESPRRQAQIRHALEVTAGRLKTGVRPTLTCFRGHQKATLGAVCKDCSRIWSATKRAKPGYAERHRQQENKRYHAQKEARV